MLKERRLIGYTLDSVNKQREAAGVQTVAAPLSTRGVQQQADFQNQQRAQSLVAQGQTDPNVVQTAQQSLKSAYVPLPSTSGGVIEQTRNERLKNATPEQIAQNQANLKGIMDAPQSVEDRVNAKHPGDQTAANNEIASEYNMQKAKQDAASTQAGNEAASSAAANEAQSNPQQAGMDALLQNLPPEMQGLGPIFQQILGDISASQEENQNVTNALLNGGEINGQKVEGINPGYNAMEQKIADMEAGYTQMQEGIQGMLDKVKEQQDEAISQQEKAQKDRLAWQETDMLRQAAREKQAAVDSRIARLALTGGFGSDGGLREIEETRASYENRLDDIKTEFGVQRTELAAKFTGLYLEASNNHLKDSIQNIKDTASALERIAGQSLSTKQARMSAENTVLNKFIDTQTASRKDYATQLKDFGKQMQDTILTERSWKKTQEDAAWKQFDSFRDLYGANIPDDVLSKLQKQIPGVDLKSLAAQPTAAELKARKGGGGSGGMYFSPSEMKSTGEPLSFDDYLRQKEADAVAGGAYGFDTGEDAMKRYKAEYDAKVAAMKTYDPVQIQTRLQDRIKNSAKNVRENAQRQVMQYLQEGRYQEADRFVDGLGSPLSATERNDYVQALNAKRNVQHISEKIDELGQMGPVIGRVREQNPYDDRVVELDNLITQTVPGLARGIFKEVGVLTDSDIQRYRDTIANPRLTADQARTATKNLLETINTSIQNQLAVHQDSGLNIRDIRERFETDPGGGQNDLVPATSADSDYIRSLGY